MAFRNFGLQIETLQIGGDPAPEEDRLVEPSERFLLKSPPLMHITYEKENIR